MNPLFLSCLSVVSPGWVSVGKNFFAVFSSRASEFVLGISTSWSEFLAFSALRTPRWNNRSFRIYHSVFLCSFIPPIFWCVHPLNRFLWIYGSSFSSSFHMTTVVVFLDLGTDIWKLGGKGNLGVLAIYQTALRTFSAFQFSLCSTLQRGICPVGDSNLNVAFKNRVSFWSYV